MVQSIEKPKGQLSETLVFPDSEQAGEFVDAIRNQRPCAPSFHDGANALAVMDAAVKSAETRAWVELDNASG